jgi:ribosomal protein L16 Arg81 hydroxylase
MSPGDFVDKYFLKFPYVSAGGALEFVSLATWETVHAILARPGVDILIVQNSDLLRGSVPTYEQVRSHHAAGSTIVIRNAERHHDGLERLASGFFADFRAPIDVHLYLTPAGQSGFGWHYDAEDVFILQTAGAKEYSLRKNTVNPWPVVEAIPRDMQYEREIMPLMNCTLAAGDWLYIPAGYWHKAVAADPKFESISIAVGVMSVPALSLLDYLRPRLAASLLWRQRLPVTGQAAAHDQEQLREEYRRIFADLLADLTEQFNDRQFLSGFLEFNSAR